MRTWTTTLLLTLGGIALFGCDEDVSPNDAGNRNRNGDACTTCNLLDGSDGSADAGSDGMKPVACTHSGDDDLVLTVELAAGAFTQDALSKKIDLGVKLVVKNGLSDVTPVAQDGGKCGDERVGNFPYLLTVEGGTEEFCLCDKGNCGGFGLVPFNATAGTYSDSVEWDGKNWSGPSDFNNPKGAAFPPGNYTVNASIKYKPSGQTTVKEVTASCPLKVLP